MNKHVPFFYALACALLAARVVLGGIRVCPECGHEVGAAARVCSHCRAELAAPAETPGRDGRSEPDGDADRRGDAGVLGPEVVQAEIEAGRAWMERGNADLARLFLRNAAALEFLTAGENGEGAGETPRSRRIVALLTACEHRAHRVARRCEACDGSGKKLLETTTLSGDVRIQQADTTPCPVCGGDGVLYRAGTIDDRKFRIGRATRRFAEIQQGRKRVPVGEAWVPVDLETRLSVAQVVRLKRAVAAPCPDCLGTGRADCGECRAKGWVACPARGCVNGRVEVEGGGRLVKSRVRRTEKCPRCGGRGRIACDDCRGRGYVLCEECEGTGARPVCTQCGGQGMTACRKCGGTGRYRGAPCPGCGAEGVTLCPSCKGDGRKP